MVIIKPLRLLLAIIGEANIYVTGLVTATFIGYLSR